jgi:hypothetical protein
MSGSWASIGARTATVVAIAIGGAAHEARAHDWLLLGGADATTEGEVYGYGGLITPIPLFGNVGRLDQDGLLLRIWGFGQRFDYSRTNLQDVDATGGGAEIGLGYQIVRPGVRVSAYVSYAFRSYQLSPDDPSSGLRRRHGVRLQLETQLDLTPQFGVSAIGSYAAVFNEYWARLRPHYALDADLRIGPEFTFFGGKDYDRQRYGGFISGVKLGPAALSFSAGGDHDARKRDWSAYFNVGASFLFSTQ